MKERLDIHSTIPSGTELRILLNSEHISYGEVQTTLREKGIFVGDSEKSVKFLFCPPPYSPPIIFRD